MIKDNNLKRNIGLLSATSIGLGAMLGAGIFVFPGLAGGQAGILAVFSFLLGGIIALMVALCTSELSTAMPKSGGGYFFISRAYGTYWGTITGISQWIGLVFACAFYLVSFSEYAYAFMKEFNFSWPFGLKVFAYSFAVLLLVVNILGTKKVGKIQNVMVITLAVILVIIFTYGILDYFGLEDHSFKVTGLAPKGFRSLFTTTALIFTSYLGFVQISNIGGEVKNPSKNLPRALIGSVIIATLLYVFIVAVTSLTFSVEELNRFGEVATVEVGRKLLGKWGAVIIVFAAILAALSSANASLISASRGVYAISEDEILLKQASKVNQRFGTPHIALILVAIPIGIVLLRSNLQILAEVSSFLHLIIYAGICISVLKFRNDKPDWYRPSFRTPFVKITAIGGAIACLVLPIFMQTTSILISLSIVAIASLYFLVYVRKKSITLSPYNKAEEEDKIDYSPKILIPVDVEKDRKDLPEAILNVLPVKKLLLLGFKEIPEQSKAKLSKEQFENKAKKKIDAISEHLEASEIPWESKIGFVKDIRSKIKEIIEEEQLQLIVLLRPLSEIKQLIIPIHDTTQIRSYLIETVKTIIQNTDATLKVILCKKNEEDTLELEKLRAKLEEALTKNNIPIEKHDTEIYKDKTIEKLIQEKTGKTDLILWSQDNSTEFDFYLNSIFDHENSEVSSTPTIIMLNI